MDKQKDILLLFLLKNFCQNNGIEDKYSPIKKKLEEEQLIEKDLEEKSIVLNKKINDYLPIKKKVNMSNINFYENIGSGSFGNVFKCLHKIDKNNYAIKIVPVYNDVNKQKYMNEVEMMSKLDHPNIVRYYNSWIESILPQDFDREQLCLEDYSSIGSEIVEYEINEFLFIQMELCFGNLNNYFQSRPEVEYIKSKSIFIDILIGLDYLHSQNIIHRDIKPSNIMFDKNEKAKIGDFGMSIKFENEAFEIIKTENEYGSYNYLAPESIDEKEYSMKSDIYSLGIILFELINYMGTFMERQEKINSLKKDMKIEQDIIDKYPKEIELVKRMLDFDIKKRPSCGTILKAIK